MPEPVFNPVLTGSAPNQLSSWDQYQSEIQRVLSATWNGKAGIENSGPLFPSRQSAVDEGQENIPSVIRRISTEEGNFLVLRGPLVQDEDPLFETSPYWGVVARFPNARLLDDKADSAVVMPRLTPTYDSRADAVADALNLPAEVTKIHVTEGTAFVVRNRGAIADDPLYATGARWGVVQRQDMAEEAAARAQALADKADLTTLDATAADLSAATGRVSLEAQRAADRAAPLASDGDLSNSDYADFSISDGAGAQLMGLHRARQVLDLGFPLGFGDGEAVMSGDAAEYLFSLEDEAGFPVLAIRKDGVILGGLAGGASGGAGDVEGFAAKRAADEVPVLDDDELAVVKSFGAEREVYVGVPFRGQAYASAAAGAGVDVGWMPQNGDVNIELGHDGAFIYSRLGFAGGSGNTLTRAPGVYTVVRVFRLSGKIVYQVVAGAVTVSTRNPIRSRSIAFGGQSHIEGGFGQGLVAGLLDGLANVQWRPGSSWMPSPVHWAPHCINGATGATAISSLSKAACWWDHAAGVAGPALETWKTRVSAAVAAGQPVPADVVWAQGEGDTDALTSGALALAEHWADLVAVFGAMRSHLIGLGASDPQFFVGLLGRGEQSLLRAKGKGYTAVRANYLRLIAETSWIHYACELYDLPGTYNDIHLGFLGHYTHGYRYSRAIANVRAGQANNLGPALQSAVLEDGGRSVRLSFTGSVLRMPSSPAAPWIIPAGGDAQSDPVPVTGVRVEGSALVVRAAQDLTGCRIAYPHGAVINPRGDSIVYDTAASDAHVKMPGLPLRSFVSNPLA